VWSEELRTRCEEARAAWTARRQALDALRRAGRSEEELAQRLKAAGHSATATDAAISELKRAGLINDRALMVELTLSHGAKLESMSSVRDRGAKRGIAADVVADTIAAASQGSSEASRALAAAQVLAAKLPARLDALARQRRLLGALQRRGYEEEVAVEAVRAVLGEAATDADDYA
jgi:SOS response regulatory protein OraA/RecX